MSPHTAPKISVIVPVYRVEEYLAQCLDSLLGQTLPDIEIICVNDGSPDNCAVILDDYAARDERIRVITQENMGLSAARNTGMPHARGEYMTFLDSDDWVAPDFYERLYNLAKQYDADVAGGNVMDWWSDARHGYGAVSERSFRTDNVIRDNIYDRRDLCHACTCWNKIYRRDFVEKHGFTFPTGRLVEDFPFTFMSTALANKVVMDKSATHFYRQRDTSIMANNKRNRNAFDKIDNHLWIFDLIKTSSLKNKEIYKQINDAFLIEDGFLWLNNVHPDSREELFTKYRDFVAKADLTHNPFASEQTRLIAGAVRRAKSLRDLNPTRRALFGLIKIKEELTKKTIKFMGVPLWKIKRTPGRTRYYMLGIRVFHKTDVDRIRAKKVVPFDAKNFSPFDMDNTAILSELKSMGKFTYFPNEGNLGDMMIAKATIDLFDANKLKYDIYKPGARTKNIVYGGGGLWTRDYRDVWIRLVKIFKSADRVVILPSSFWGADELIEILDERFTVFAREKRSYDYLVAAGTRAKIILDHDMAFRMTPRALDGNILVSRGYKRVISQIDESLDKTPRVATLTRIDPESAGGYNPDFDLSQQLLVIKDITPDKIGFACLVMLLAADAVDAIITDRLHVAIAGLLMGKEVYMLDNTYGKLSAVYENSFRNHPRAHFCKTMPDKAAINPPHTATDNFKKLAGAMK